MENSDAWKRLNVMATKWVKRVEGKGEMKLLGLDRDLGNKKEVNRETDLDGNQVDLEIKGGENPGVEDIKEGDVDSTVNQKENEDLSGFDQEQMNVLKALLHGVSRDSLVHVQGLSEPIGKRVLTQLGEKFTEVKDSVKVRREEKN